MRRLLLIVTMSCVGMAARAQKFPDLARTPPMGWNSWNRFHGLSHREADFSSTTYGVRDLWSNRDVGTTAQSLPVTVAPHGAELYRLRKR